MPIRKTLAEFQADCKRAGDLLDIQFREMLRLIIVALVQLVAERTPVLSPDLQGHGTYGRAAGSWFVTTGQGNKVVPDGQESSAAESINRVLALKFSDPYTTWYLYNNVEYIKALEYGLYPGDGPHTSGSFSTQAPEGMLRISVEDVKGMLREIKHNALRG